jgi:hypothetical protein
MTDKTNSTFSKQQRTQISNACERVQNAININNSTLAQLNADLVRKADEIAIKWKAYGLPYNAIRDAAIEMALWQKEQMMKGLCYETKVYRDEEGDGIDTPIESWLALENNEITNLPNIGLKDGDKVKILIIKEDEQ